MIALVFIGTILFLWLAKAPVMSSYLTRKLNIPVSMLTIGIGPTKATIRNFKVKNPRGFKIRTAFKAAKIEIGYHFKDLFGTPTKINEIVATDVFLSIEFSNPLGTRNNWTALGARIPPDNSKTKGKGVSIGVLALKDIAVEVRGLGLKGAPETRHIDLIELHNIDSAKGFPTQELIRKIFENGGLDAYIQEAFDPDNVIEKFLNPLKGFGG